MTRLEPTGTSTCALKGEDRAPHVELDPSWKYYSFDKSEASPCRKFLDWFGGSAARPQPGTVEELMADAVNFRYSDSRSFVLKDGGLVKSFEFMCECACSATVISVSLCPCHRTPRPCSSSGSVHPL